jgi:hypothetical protein
MTDIINLYFYKNKIEPSNTTVDTPSLKEFGLKSMLHYNLTNKNIIKKQIEIAKQYCIYGFAIYYYWFSTNTITKKNTIMESCYNLFFKERINDFKIFFIWSNKDWINFSKKQIKNDYNFDSFKKNINNLMIYFKNPNYYKINNKPVFYIHHPYLIPEDKLLLFYNLLFYECIQNGFSGVLLVINNMDINLNSLNNYNKYNFHPNINEYKFYYKKTNVNDYDKYIETFINDENEKDNTQSCVFFNFNNSPRLCIPNKLNLVTEYINTTIYNQDGYLKKVLSKYHTNESDDELNKILLVNSWNEWGKNMAIEPGNINNYKYLLLIKSNLISFL